jgi:hypothetical protein
LGQAHKYGGGKPVNAIPTLPLLITELVIRIFFSAILGIRIFF